MLKKYEKQAKKDEKYVSFWTTSLKQGLGVLRSQNLKTAMNICLLIIRVVQDCH